MFINYFSNMMVESNMNESDLYTGLRFKVSAKRPGEAGIVPTAKQLTLHLQVFYSNVSLEVNDDEWS